jgi:hypothetical protein
LATLKVQRALACLSDANADMVQASRFICDGLLLAVQFNIFTLDKLVRVAVESSPAPGNVRQTVCALWSAARIGEECSVDYEFEARKSQDADGTHTRTVLEQLGHVAVSTTI